MCWCESNDFLVSIQGEKGAEQEETHAEARLYFALFCKAILPLPHVPLTS
jgi:hypothetical protein